MLIRELLPREELQDPRDEQNVHHERVPFDQPQEEQEVIEI